MARSAISRRAVLTMGAAALVAGAARSARAAPSVLGRRVPTLAGYVGDYHPFDTPQILPRVVFLDAAGSRLDLSVMAGRVVLLNFWATWCAPCLVELPDLDRLQAEYSDKRFVVLALCVDSQSIPTVAEFLSTRGLNRLGVFVDPTGNDLHNCAITAIPTTFIIDRLGRACGMLPGAAPWDSAAGRALIEYYLADTSNAAARNGNG